ncbi:hypothetical protein CTI12_AA078260 [Artemisia annua]|uniref:Uncharacterized protein n=1 Tax=Artemisia annua TaxID=35608 RepID=A0A2U1Q3M3_ARTAN|nr:hypothetical protein CTI12_AA078260 [Artemisia annua]
MIKEMGMQKLRNLGILVFLLMIFGSSQSTRDFSSQPQVYYPQRYPKMLFTLGMECKCCDGASSNENCESIWKGSCSKLQCLPWKQYHHV